jgi:hypothetical protein
VASARAAARALGIPHPTLGYAWDRFGIEVRPPTRAGGPRLVGDRLGVSSTPEPAHSLPPAAGTKKSAPYSSTYPDPC